MTEAEVNASCNIQETESFNDVEEVNERCGIHPTDEPIGNEQWPVDTQDSISNSDFFSGE